MSFVDDYLKDEENFKKEDKETSVPGGKSFTDEFLKPTTGAPEALGLSLRQAEKTNPDEHVKVLQTSKESGLPSDMVGRNRPKIDAGIKEQKTRAALNSAPGTGQFFSNPDNLKVAHDDVDNLVSTEGLIGRVSPEVLDAQAEFERREFVKRELTPTIAGKDAMTPEEIRRAVPTGKDVDFDDKALSSRENLGAVYNKNLLAPGQGWQTVKDTVAPVPAMAYILYRKAAAGLAHAHADALRQEPPIYTTFNRNQKERDEWRAKMEAKGEDPTAKEIDKWATRVSREADMVSRQIREEHPNANETVQGALTSMYMQGPGLALGVLGGLPAGLTPFFVEAFGGSYDEMTEHDIDPTVKFFVSFAKGASEVGTELIPMDTLLKRGLGPGNRMLKSYVSELIGENINTTISAALDKMTIRPGMTWSDLIKELWQTTKQTAVQTTLMGGGATIIHRTLDRKGKKGVAGPTPPSGEVPVVPQWDIPDGFRDREDYQVITGELQRAAKTKVNKETLEGLSANAQASKLLERSPELYKEYIAQIKEGKDIDNVYIPAEKWFAYFQEAGLDPIEEARKVSPDAAIQLQEALDAGEDFVVPLETYLSDIAITEHHDALVAEARLSPDDMTVSEAQAFDETADDRIAELKGAVDQEAGPGRIERIISGTAEQIEATGKVSGKRARLQAEALYGSFFKYMGERMGVAPEEVFEQYGVRVEGPAETLARAEDIEDLKESEIYGPSLLEFISKGGGVKDTGGDLSALGVDAWHKERPFRKKVVSEKGRALDDMAFNAWEAGYFPQFTETPDINELLNAIDRELRGDPLYSEQNIDRDALAEREALEEGRAEFDTELFQSAQTFKPKDISETTLPETTINLLPSHAEKGEYYHATAEQLVEYLDRHGDGFLYRVAHVDGYMEGFERGDPEYLHTFKQQRIEAKAHSFTTSLEDAKNYLATKEEQSYTVYRIDPRDLSEDFTVQIPSNRKLKGVLKAEILHIQSPHPASTRVVDVIYRDGVWDERTPDDSRRTIEEWRTEADRREVSRLRGDARRGRREGVDAEVDKTFFQEEAPTFFSQLENTITQKMPNKASGTDVLNLVSKGAVKAEEIKWSGIEEFLSAKKSVTKEEVIEHLRLNRIEVTEDVKGEVPEGTFSVEEDDVDGGWLVRDKIGEIADNGLASDFESREEAEQWIKERVSVDTKFADYTLPGGENYKEMLLRLPTEIPSRIAEDATLSEADKTYLARKEAKEFKSSHFDEPNILAHVRFNERTDSEGNKVLFLEELQSDWALAGRKQGFTEDAAEYGRQVKELESKFSATQKEHELARKALSAFQEEVKEEVKADNLSLNAVMDRHNKRHLHDNWTSLGKELTKIRNEIDEVRVAQRLAVPSAPLLKNWHELALKRMLRYAAENDFDKMAWITGEQTQDRYDLSKKISEIAYNGTDFKAFDLGGKEVISRTGVRSEDIPDLIGKEPAKRLLAKDKVGGLYILAGEDLKVGGEWATTLYDKVIPNYLKKYGKKWGAKVEGIEINTGELAVPRYPKASAKIRKITTQQSIPITEEMKQSVLGVGQPLFQDKRGVIRFNKDLSQSVIGLFEKADPSTLIHETGHYFLEVLKAMSLTDGAPKDIVQDYKVVREWLAVEEGEEFTAEHHEKWARGFEAFLREGRAPSAALRKAFAQFRDWLLGVYKSLRDLDVNITPEIEAVMGRMLASQEEIDIEQGLAIEDEAISLIIEGEQSEELTLDAMSEVLADRNLSESRIEDLRQTFLSFVEVISKDEALKDSWEESKRSARKAFREGKEEGVKKEHARMKDIILRARGRKEETAKVRKLKKAILKEIKTTQVKKQSGKPVGKFTADIQVVLDQLRAAVKMSEEDAAERIVHNLEKHLKEDMPEAVAVENRILDMVIRLKAKTEKGGTLPLRRKFTAEELESLLHEIKLLKLEGKMLTELSKMERRERHNIMVTDAVDVITGGEGLPAGLETTGVEEITPSPKEFRAWGKNILNTLGAYFVGWNDITDMLSAREKGSLPGRSRLDTMSDVHLAENAVKAGNRLATEQIAGMAKDSFGFETDKEMLNQFNADAKEMTIGTFITAKDATVTLKMTKAEARKFVMEYSDPTLRETFHEGMGYTDDMIKSIHETLTVQDKAFVKEQMAFYRSYYDRVNAVYRDIYGVDLPFNEFYSPIRREGFGEVDGLFGAFLDEVSLRRSVVSGSVKSRVKNLKRISKQSDVNVLEQHVAEMEHFIAWGEKIRELNAIYKNPEVRAAIKLHHGPSMLHVIDRFINDMTRGGVELANRMGWLDKIRGNYTRSVLAAKLAITIKQLTSALAYMEVMPITEYVKGQASFWANPLKHYKFLKKNSVWFKERSGNMDRDIKTALKMQEHSAFLKSKGFLNSLMLNVTLGDQGAIAIGGWGYYQYLTKKKGLSHEAAIQEFERFSERTQQSADVSMLSHFQRLGSAAKLFSMFMSAPNLYMRKELGAIRNLFAGRGSVKDHIKTVTIYHVLLPMLFQLVSDGFDWEEGHQKRAVILGSLNGLFIIGDGIEYVISKALGERAFKSQIAILSPFDDFGKFISEAVEAIAEGELTEEEFYRAIRGLSGAVGATTGLPLKQAADQFYNVGNFVDGEFEKAVKGAIGYSPYIVEQSSN